MGPPMTDLPSTPAPAASPPGWWGRRTLLAKLLLISLGLLLISGYLVARDVSRPAPDFDGATAWINSKPLRFDADLAGKVVLVDFWTLSCINCIRTFPYLKAWDEKYRSQGLVIIGVHTPEFAFEQTSERVEQAVADFGIRYPVAVDNHRNIWDAYANHWWPHKYLIDSHRRIRNEWIGEGSYEDTEKAIQRVLAEERGIPMTRGPVQVSAEPVDVAKIRTPEIYFGHGFSSDFGGFALGNQPAGQIFDTAVAYTLPEPAQMEENHFYLGGTWTLQDENAVLTENDGEIVLNYEAKSVNLVAAHANRPVTVYILRDGHPLTSSIAGADIQYDRAGRSYVAVDRGRMYRLITDPGGYGRHRVQLQIREKGFEVYTLTFG